MKLKLVNPFTDKSEDLSAGSAIGKVGWIIATVLITAFAQNVVRMIGQKTAIDTTIGGTSAFGDAAIVPASASANFI